MSLTCDLNPHYFVVISVIIVLLAFLFPLIMYAKLTALHNDEVGKNRMNLLSQSHLAFLSISYKPDVYYWEFIRMAERLLFILIASIFNSIPILKIILLIFILQGYSHLMKMYSPFKK